MTHRVTLVTAARRGPRFDPDMPEIVVEEDWRERLWSLLPSRRHAWAIPGAILLLVVVGVALWTRGRPAQIAIPASSATSMSTPALETQAVAGILVHVAGAVRAPGLYELVAGSRVADAIELAGGPRRSADIDALNLAEVLIDGIKIDVPRRGGSVAATSSPEAATGSALVSLNSSDAATLEVVPGIGPVKAAAIIEYRTQIGGFDSIEQLLEVDGIGPATLEALRAHVTL